MSASPAAPKQEEGSHQGSTTTEERSTISEERSTTSGEGSGVKGHATAGEDWKRLLSIIEETCAHSCQTPAQPSPSSGTAFISAHQTLLHARNDYDEVYPQLVLGNESLARDLSLLRRERITHVLNCAEGRKFGQVSTGSEFYKDVDGVLYLGLPAHDSVKFDMSAHVAAASEFIEAALNQSGDSRVYIHCHQGLSRSAFILLSFLMTRRSMTAEEVIRCVTGKRTIRPNNGFLRQLAVLDGKLRRTATEGDGGDTGK